MLILRTCLRVFVLILLFFLTSGCSKEREPVVYPTSPNLSYPHQITSNDMMIENLDAEATRNASTRYLDNYIEKTGPEELLNSESEFPITYLKRPVFTGILHATEETAIREIGATINNVLYYNNIVFNGKEITFSPDFDLKPGRYNVYLAIIFDNDKIACATWRFIVLDTIVQISGFLGDEKGRQYFICFNQWVDKKLIEDTSNWTLNGDSSLIEKTEFLDWCNWAKVQLVSNEQKADFRDQDYILAFNNGFSTSEVLLIPEEKIQNTDEGKESEGCGEIIHDVELDINRFIESDFFAITYEVKKEPDCNLEAEWTMDLSIHHQHSDGRTAPLTQTRDMIVSHNEQLSHVFPLAAGHHTLFFPFYEDASLGIKVWDNDNPPNLIWQSPPEWSFQADNETPTYTLTPRLLKGEEVADFLEDHYWDKLNQVPGVLPWQISNMLELLRSDELKCNIFCIWGAEDRKPGGLTHLGCLSEYGWLDWGWDENAPPYDNWNSGDCNPLNVFSLDLPPPANSELRAWSDQEYNPLEIDSFSDGEYKVWIFDYEGFIQIHDDIILEHDSSFIMKPRVEDVSFAGGNWKRADNIYRSFSSYCDSRFNGFKITFLEPSGADRKQYININPSDTLPTPVPNLNQVGNKISVQIKIEKDIYAILTEHHKLYVYWDDPAITGVSSNRKFPWLTDSRESCPPAGTLWPFVGEPNVLFPNSQSSEGDNSDSTETTEMSFKQLNSKTTIYDVNFNYKEGGFGTERSRTRIFNLLDYPELECNNEVIIEFDFYTSNFAGDNYRLCASIFSLPGLLCAFSSSPVITVWRLMYLEYAYMNNPDEIICHEGNLLNEYDHYSGSFDFGYSGMLSYISNALNECFIEVRAGKNGGIDSKCPTKYEFQLPDLDDNPAEYSHLSYYANEETNFHNPSFPHSRQILSVDSNSGYACPLRNYTSENLIGATTRHQDERKHCFVFFGGINDLDSIGGIFAVDSKILDNMNHAAYNVALHELGHSIAFMQDIDNEVTRGHESGPGVMWKISSCPETTQRNMIKSYFWGDHIFILRAAPDI
jgi:hypothetical protein